MTREPKIETVNGIAIPKRIDAQRDLAVLLNDCFKGQLSLVITSTVVGNWRRGIGLGQVVIDGQMVRPPNFPARNKSKYWEPPECVEWVRRWIVPQKAVGTVNGQTHPDSAQEFENKKKEQDLWRWQRERDISDGEYGSRAQFRQHLTALGLAINRALNGSEQRLQQIITADVRARLPDEALLPVIQQAITDGSRAAMDGLRVAVVKALEEIKENEKP